jgi:hypothetical protein
LIRCIGIGIVDENRLLLYISTLCSIDQLHDANVLIMSSTGDIELPINELKYQGPYESMFSYQPFATKSVITTPVMNFRLIHVLTFRD